MCTRPEAPERGQGPLSRRSFLASLAAGSAVAAGILPGCTTPTSTTSGILDTHTHFYDPTRPEGVPWPPKDDSILYRPVYPAEWKSLANPLGVTTTVVVEASPWVADNAWILALADRDPSLVGLVGHLKPGRPGFTEDLDRFGAHPRFRGFRTGGWDVQLAPERPEVLRDLERLAERSLALDVLVGPDQLPAVAHLAGRIPSLRVVIDHCANVRIDGKEPPSHWRQGIEMAASHPNVFMKVSGLVEGTGRTDGTAPADTAFYRYILDPLWHAFGSRRLLFGSNWPVSARFASYATVLSVVRDYFATKGSEAQARYLRENAREVYGV